jgi:molecular chaperone DnaJ
LEDYFYQILEVDESATPEEIKKSYERLSEINHPDLHNGKMIYTVYMDELNTAYKVLSDPVSKMHYDAGLKIHGEFGFGKNEESELKNVKKTNYFKDIDIKDQSRSKYSNLPTLIMTIATLLIIYFLFKLGCG